MTVLDAIALAGGFKDFATKKSIYVLRQNNTAAESFRRKKAASAVSKALPKSMAARVSFSFQPSR
jgi:protein involved in polysaccharide export with SLBB domain